VLPIDVLGTEVAARVVGVVRHFPTVHGNVVVADRQWVATALNANDPGPPFYNEIWLNAQHPQQVAQELGRRPFVGMKVDSRTSVTDESKAASLVRAARDLFLIGAIAAVALAVLGMALAATSDVRARRWEILDLRGQGADHQWIARFVRRRLVVSCAFAGVVGAVAGVALLFATVSLLRIAADFRQPDPPLRMSLPWIGIAGSALAVAAVATLLVTVLVRSQLREIGQSRT
jgi:predicted lysophospholipase L1 biosynthesis ABC-type transport system permease subunit